MKSTVVSSGSLRLHRCDLRELHAFLGTASLDGRCYLGLYRTIRIRIVQGQYRAMDSIIYLVGLIVVVMFILSMLGLR